MLKFKQADLRKMEISAERLLEIIQDFGFKVDPDKVDMRTLYNLVNTNLAQQSEKELVLAREEGLNQEEIEEISFSEKQDNELFFQTGLALLTLEILRKEANQIYIQNEEQKRLEQIYRIYISNIEDEKDRSMAAEMALIDHQNRELADRQAIMDDYIQNTENRLNELRSEAKALKERIGQLNELKTQTIDQASKQIAVDLDTLKTADGRPIFEDFTQEQKETFAKGLLSDMNKNERVAKKKLEAIDLRLNKLEEQKNVLIEQMNVPKYMQDRSQSGGYSNRALTLGYSRSKSIGSIQRQIDAIDRQQKAALHEKEAVQNQLIIDNNLAVIARVEEAGKDPDKILAGTTPTEVFNKFSNLDSVSAANEQVHRLEDENDLDIDKLENIQNYIADMQKENSEMKKIAQEQGLSNRAALDNLDHELNALLDDIGSDLDLGREQPSEKASLPARVSR